MDSMGHMPSSEVRFLVDVLPFPDGGICDRFAEGKFFNSHILNCENSVS